jgi:hypothetical protein
MLKKLVLIGVSAILSACSTPGGGFLNTNIQADAGSEPTQYEKIIRGSLGSNSNISNIMIAKPELASCAVGIYGSFHGWRVATSYTTTQHSYGSDQVKFQVYYYWFHGENLKGIGEARDYCADAPSWLR